MPNLIPYIDAIARSKGRGVLYIIFSTEGEDEMPPAEWIRTPFLLSDYRSHKARNKVIEFLDNQQIPWHPCGSVAEPGLMISYQGQIYIDLPFDRSLPGYQQLEAFLENPDGTMRIPHTLFVYLPLELALRNVEHDQPDFWARQCEGF